MKAAILKTLKYFDLQHNPLTLMELERYLLKADSQPFVYNFDLLLQSIEEMVKEKTIESKDGFYFLPGRRDLVDRRIEAYALCMERLQKTSRLLKLLRYVPFVRGIAIGGSLAGMYSKQSSDIDFMVITKPGRIWLARLFISGATQLLGIRRHGNYIANRVCLNHYVAQKYRLPADHTDYAAVEYNSLLCLLGRLACHDFISSQNWLADHFVNPPSTMPHSFYTVKPSKIIQPALEAMVNLLGGQILEKLAGAYQKKRIQTGPTVMVSDNELAFHPHSKGRALLDKLGGQTS